MDSYEAQDRWFGGSDNSMYECSQSDNLTFLRSEVERLEVKLKKAIKIIADFGDAYQADVSGILKQLEDK